MPNNGIKLEQIFSNNYIDVVDFVEELNRLQDKYQQYSRLQIVEFPCSDDYCVSNNKEWWIVGYNE